jgi:hypothetical protein
MLENLGVDLDGERRVQTEGCSSGGDDLAAERDADLIQCAPKACPCGILVGFGPQKRGGNLARHRPACLGEVDEERGCLAQGELHPPPV